MPPSILRFYPRGKKHCFHASDINGFIGARGLDLDRPVKRIFTDGSFKDCGTIVRVPAFLYRKHEIQAWAQDIHVQAHVTNCELQW